MSTTSVVIRRFHILLLLTLFIFAIGCEGGREDILSLSLYNISLVDDEESTAGGYTKLYVTLKDPTFNIEIFPNARAAMDSKAWDNVWVNSALSLSKNSSLIPQTIGFESSEERDTFINILTNESAEGVSWKHESKQYYSEFLSEVSDGDTVYVVTFTPIIPDPDDLTPAQRNLLDKTPPVLLDSYPLQFAYEKLVRILDLGHQPVGTYQNKSRAAYWNDRNAVGESVASGVYFYTLRAGEFTATRKMLIRK